MPRKFEVRSLRDGAWYEVHPGQCSVVWSLGRPCVRIKYLDFGYEECELFELKTLFERRFRVPFLVAETADTLKPGLRVVGLAKSRTEQKWFDAEVEKLVFEEGDTLVVVTWCLGMGEFVFGTPLSHCLSVEKGEVGSLQSTLSPETHPVLREWVATLRELSGNAEVLEEAENRQVYLEERERFSQIAETPRQDYAPSSFGKRSARRRGAETDDSPETKRRRRESNAGTEAE